MMPLLCKVNIYSILKYILPTWLKLPKYLILPNSNLYNDGNILNDSFDLIPVKQIIQVYYYIDKFNLLNLLNNENCVMIYASEEKINIISQETLDMLLDAGVNLHIVEGRHECFNENNHSFNFFKVFNSLLS